MFRLMIQKALFMAFLLFYFAGSIYGQSRLTAPGQIEISMVTIGQIYDFKKISGTYYEVANYVQDGLKLKIEPLIPSPDRLASKEFEPIPDLSWVRLDKEEFTLKYGENTSANFYLTIPDDAQLLGKKYQFNLSVYAINYPRPLSLTTQILVTISEGRISPMELIQKLELNELEFDLTPHKCLLSNFPLGKKIDISQFTGKPFELSNQSEQKYVFTLTVSSSTENCNLEIPKNQRGDTDFLTLDSGEVILESYASKKFHPCLSIPDQENYRDKELIFLIKAQVLGQIPEQSRFSIIRVKTGGK